MELAPVQYKQFNGLFTARRAEARQPPPQSKSLPGSSTDYALGFLVAINGAFFLFFEISREAALQKFGREWPSSLTARWIAPLSPELAVKALKYWAGVVMRGVERDFLNAFALSRETLVHGKKPWTPFTATFTHLSYEHLRNNVLAVFAVGRVVRKVPGMNALHILGITLGCSIASSSATWYRYQGLSSLMSIHGFGFSAVVSALTSVAVLGTPDERVLTAPVPGTPGLSIPYWCIAAMQAFSDVARTVRHLAGTATRQDREAGTLEHVAGYAFGAAYYWILLRPRRLPISKLVFAASTGQKPHVRRRATM